MSLVFETTINLTQDTHNSPPPLVEQLSIIHEARDGELVQYYINTSTKAEGDKNTYGVGIPVYNEYNQIDHYDYIEYTDAYWAPEASRITKQSIDRLGTKAFPNIGAIAFYKLAYRNISRILAPVNYISERSQAPTLTYNISQDARSITVTLADPIDPYTGKPSVEYAAFRVILAIGEHSVERVTYEKTITISNLPVTGDYLLYAIGYINEGEICSHNTVEQTVHLIGPYASWPIITPGNHANTTYTIARELEAVNLIGSNNSVSSVDISPSEYTLNIAASEWGSNHKVTKEVNGIYASSSVIILPLLASSQDNIDNNIALQAANIMECEHGNNTITLYAVNVPSSAIRVRICVS